MVRAPQSLSGVRFLPCCFVAAVAGHPIVLWLLGLLAPTQPCTEAECGEEMHEAWH